jgi:hypothetical protein
MLQCSRRVNQSAAGKAGVCGILLTGETMKSFLERLAARDELPSASSGPELVEGGRVGGRRSFRDLGMGGTAALSHSASSRSTLSSRPKGSWPRGLPKGMRRGQNSPINKSLKKQTREPWNERKGFTVCAHFN